MYGMTYRDSQTTPRDVAWRMIRNLRHDAPGHAAAPAFRRRIFDAALEQAEQLFRASESAGPQSQPVLLFYGLSQAGRAISAAASNVANGACRFDSHGITVKDLSAANNAPLADLVVIPEEGAFRQVATILGSSDFSPEITVGALCGMLPGMDAFPLVGSLPNLPLTVVETMTPGTRAAADVYPLPSGIEYNPPDSTVAARGDEAGWQGERERVSAYLANYPTLAGFEFQNPIGPTPMRPNTDGTNIALLCWQCSPAETTADVLDRHSVTYLGERFVFPSVGDSPLPVHPLAIWWAVLYCLSMLARYQPDAWGTYVNVSKCADAVPIEALLDNALNTLPETIHRAIMSAAT